MAGTILNIAGILAGALFALISRKQPSPAHQAALKLLLGVFTVWVGLSMTWKGLNGTFGQIAGQFGILLLSLILGNLLGKLCRLQKGFNHLGQYARERLSGAPGKASFGEGFLVSSLLFCANPLGIHGAVFDGLTGNFQVLLIKAVLDGLTALALVPTLGRGVLLSPLPVLAWQGTLSLLVRVAQPWLAQHGLIDSFNATGGLLVFTVSLIVLNVKKVELADYLPALIIAPLLTWWWM